MSGINIKYTLLFTLSVEQFYYQNKLYAKSGLLPSADFEIRATAECLRIMNRTGLIFKPNAGIGGGAVYASVNGSNAAGNLLLTTKVRKFDKLTFILLLKNPSAFTFDDLPPELSGENIFVFSNQISDATAARNDLHLSEDPDIATVTDIIKGTSSSFRYLHTALVNPDTARIRHNLTAAEIKPKSAEDNGNRTALVFDLSLLPDGKCTLFIQNAVVQEFYYLKDIISKPVFGAVELSLAPTLAENYRIIENDFSIVPARPVYKIRLQNRKTHWRYLVQLTPLSSLYHEISAMDPADKADFLDHINIISNDANLAFTPKTMTESLFVFESDVSHFLREKYLSSSGMAHDALKLSLKKNIGSGEKDVKTDLPFPNAGGGLDVSNYPNVYSIIYITL